MALNTPAFKHGLKALLDNLSERVDNPEQAKIDFCTGMTELVEAFVKSATVSVPGTGLTAPNGAVTGKANGTIS
jgi:hypothetical protein